MNQTPTQQAQQPDPRTQVAPIRQAFLELQEQALKAQVEHGNDATVALPVGVVYAVADLLAVIDQEALPQGSIPTAVFRASVGVAEELFPSRSGVCGAIPADVRGPVPCHLDPGHEYDGVDHFSTSGCAGSEIRWNQHGRTN